MSRKNENGSADQDAPGSAGDSGSNIPPENNNQGSPPPGNPPPGNKLPENTDSAMLAIEEHRVNLDINVPVFRAVMQEQGWAAGKKITEAAFIDAVESFLGSPIGGK